MQSARLPKRVPVGTKYIIEGQRADEGQLHIVSRYLVFPDGRCFDLPSDVPVPAERPRRTAKRH